MAPTIRVLHVEDSEDEAFLIQAALKKAGLSLAIDRADSVEALEEKFDPARYDLVLADFHLGDADGFKALEIVRAKDREIPFIVISGAIGEEQAVAMLRAGANDYVMKDRLLRLGQVIPRELEEREQRRVRQEAQRLSSVHHAVVTVLANATSVVDAAREILPVIGANFGWKAARLVLGDARLEWGTPEAQPTAKHAIRHAEELFGGLEVFSGAKPEVDDEAADTLTSICLELGQAASRELALVRLKASEARHKLLADTSGMLMQHLDDNASFEVIAKRLVPELGDWCEIDLRDGDGGLRRCAFAHVDPKKIPPSDHGMPSGDWLGRKELVPAVDEELLRSLARDESRRGVLENIGISSAIAVPLFGRDRTRHAGDDPRIGVLVLARGSGSQPLGDDELNTAREVALRISASLENARLYREVEESLRARDEFITVAAHELKTPLTPLRVNIGSLIHLAAGAPPIGPSAERIRSRLERLDKISERLTLLVEHLLDVSRITVGRLSLDLEKFDLAGLLTHTLEQLSEEVDRSGCRVSLNIPQQSVFGRWDKRRLAVVIRSAVSNALKFGAGRPIEIELVGDDQSARLTVRDHGPGLSPAAQRTVFERFNRGVSVRNYGGFGLGLWVVREIVEEHGGTVSVSSRPLEGVELQVVLPREAVARTASAGPAEAATPSK